MKKLLIIVCIIFSILNVTGQINVYKILEGGKLENVGGNSKNDPLIISNPSKLSGTFFYSLPLTAIKVEVEVIEKHFIKGPYAEYADRMLGLKNIVKEDYYEYELTNINIGTESRPDPNCYYYVEILNSKTAKEYTAQLSESGLLDQITKCNISDITLNKKSEFYKNTLNPDIFKLYAASNQYEKVDTVFRTITIENEVITKQYLTSTLVEKPNESKAKEMAANIGKIRESRLNLISGYQETSYEKNTLEYMVGQLDALENEYMSLFKGISLSKKKIYTYYYIPENDVKQDYIPLFKFSKEDGLLDLNSVKGREVTIMISKDNTTSKLSQLTNKINNGKRGIYYRIPEYAEVKINFMGREIDKKTVLVNQLGVIAPLLPNLGQLQLHPQTGSLKSVEL